MGSGNAEGVEATSRHGKRQSRKGRGPVGTSRQKSSATGSEGSTSRPLRHVRMNVQEKSATAAAPTQLLVVWRRQRVTAGCFCLGARARCRSQGQLWPQAERAKRWGTGGGEAGWVLGRPHPFAQAGRQIHGTQPQDCTFRMGRGCPSRGAAANADGGSLRSASAHDKSRAWPARRPVPP